MFYLAKENAVGRAGVPNKKKDVWEGGKQREKG